MGILITQIHTLQMAQQDVTPTKDAMDAEDGFSGFSPMSLQDQLNHHIARIESLEKRVTTNELDIRKINSHSMRRNLLFDNVFLKKDLENDPRSVRGRVLNFINQTLLNGQPPLIADWELNDVHPTQATNLPYQQVVVEFKVHDIAKRVIFGGKNCKNLNDGRLEHARQAAIREKKDPNKVRVQYIRVSWQKEEVSRKMAAYLTELKTRIIFTKPALNPKSIVITQPSRNKPDPHICLAGKEYSVHNLPVELLQLMNMKHFDRDYVRPGNVFRPSAEHRSALEKLCMTEELQSLVVSPRGGGVGRGGGKGRNGGDGRNGGAGRGGGHEAGASKRQFEHSPGASVAVSPGNGTPIGRSKNRKIDN
jgi:hypothetical protein